MSLLSATHGAIAGAEPPPAPEITNANCYPATGLATVPVTSAATLQTAINNADPGDHIELDIGAYNGVITISCQGTEANPIVIKPAGALLSASAGGRFEFTNTSRWTVVLGIDFNGGEFRLLGDHNRVDRCRFRNGAGLRQWLTYQTARDCRVSRCEFDGSGSSPGKHAVDNNEGGYSNGTNVRNRFDHCYVHDVRATDLTAGGAQELWALQRKDENIDMGGVDVCTIDTCLFTNWSAPDEGEMFTLKSGGWTITHCTFDGNDGWVNNRQAIGNKFISSWFEDFTSNGNAGLNLKGNEHLVAGCRFVRSHCEAAPGNFSLDDELSEDFQNRTGSSPHPAAMRCQIVDCVFDNCQLRIGPNDGYPGGQHDAEDNNQFGNTFQNGGQLVLGPQQNGTTNVDPGLGSFDAAVKLTPADVGLNADDPYC